MWKYLLEFFRRPSTIESSSLIETTASSLALMPAVAPLPPIDLLWIKVAHLSNAQYRFLHPTYSPGSRVPCSDFSSFIVDRLCNGDTSSIKQLMRAVIAGNPGLGIGPEWIDKDIDEIAGINFPKYCETADADFFLELKALFIIGAKAGGNRPFWLAGEYPLLFALALCCHNVTWREDVESLRKEANRFIRRMRKDVPFWVDYPLFSTPGPIHFPDTIASGVVSVLASLPMLARVQLLSISERGGSASLMHATTYNMRSFGLNPIETSEALLASGICELASDIQSLMDVFTKHDLFNTLEKIGVPHRKSWTKSQLIAALGAHAPEFVSEVASREKTVSIRPEFLSDLRSILAHANAMQEYLKLLFFATSEIHKSGK